jgi:cytosine/adenosine deaminase-related metal-dependent hydrolase
MASSLIRGKYVICRAGADAESSTVLTDGAIFQRDGVIEDVGDYATLKASHQPDEEIGGPNYVVFPGLVNAHHHGRGVSTFQMGTCDDSLETWILSGWGRRPYDHYLMTLYTALQMMESGTTTVMYNHPQTPVSGLEDDVDQVLKGFADAGMRTAFSIYLREQNRLVYADDQEFLSGLPSDLAGGLRRFLSAVDLSADDYFALFEKLHDKYGADTAGKVTVLLSPSNVQWVSDDFLQRTKEYAVRYRAGIHMHLVESFYQKEYGLRAWSQTPVAHLAELGFLGPELSCAHAVWLTGDDMDLLAQSGVTVCHNPSSNLRLKNGVAPVNAMLAKVINVALGTDSTAINDDDDMLQEVRLASKLHREPGIDAPALSTHQALGMATINRSPGNLLPRPYRRSGEGQAGGPGAAGPHRDGGALPGRRHPPHRRPCLPGQSPSRGYRHGRRGGGAARRQTHQSRPRRPYSRAPGPLLPSLGVPSPGGQTHVPAVDPIRETLLPSLDSTERPSLLSVQ